MAHMISHMPRKRWHGVFTPCIILRKSRFKLKEFIVKPHVLSQRHEYRVSWGLLDQRQWSFYYSHIINFINTGRLYIKRNYRDRWTTTLMMMIRLHCLSLFTLMVYVGELDCKNAFAKAPLKKKVVLVVVPNVENKMKICIFTSSLISFQKTRVLLL